MKIAICISGQLRTWKECYKTWDFFDIEKIKKYKLEYFLKLGMQADDIRKSTKHNFLLNSNSPNPVKYNIKKLRCNCKDVKPPITEKQLKSLVDNIYSEIKDEGKKIKSSFIGEKVLSHLKEFNEVAYLRYASVYKEFSDASDFEKEVAEFN